VSSSSNSSAGSSSSSSSEAPCSERQAPAGWRPVRTAEDLVGIALDYTANYLQLCDIDLGALDWEPIPALRGIYDGNGYRILNVSNVPEVDRYEDAPDEVKLYGLFGSLGMDGVIRNVTLENVHFRADSKYVIMGGLLAQSAGPPFAGNTALIQNVRVSGLLESWGSDVGGIVGLHWGIAESVESRVSISSLAPHLATAGGVAGSARGEGVVRDAFWEGVITLNNWDDNQIGGIIGTSQTMISYTPSTTQLSHERLTAIGRIDGGVGASRGSQVGGLVGTLYGTADRATQVSIANSSFSGEISARSDVGGLVGHSYSNSSLTRVVLADSLFQGTVRGSKSVGGILGYGNRTDIVRAIARGQIVGGLEPGVAAVGGCGLPAAGPFSAMGGIAGTFQGDHGESAPSRILDSSFVGVVQTPHDIVGGIVGTAYTGVRIERSYARGQVSGRRLVGGLIGRAFASDAAGSIELVNSYADVSATADLYGGKLMGYLAICPASSARIENSYAIGEVAVEDQQQPTIPFGALSIVNSYVSSESASPSDHVYASPRTFDELSIQATFQGWDFTNVWRMPQPEGVGTPELR
jgi:hypothetical protein